MLRTCLFFVCLLAISAPLHVLAQTGDAIGIRAQGMGGAFTAVADDATAAWWNPAGLAAGAYFNAIFETTTQRQPGTDGAIPAWRTGTRGFSVAYPAMALSYYRLRVSEIEPSASTAGVPASRQDPGSPDTRLRSLVMSHFGATVGQSLGQHLVIASTVKLIRGSVATDLRAASSASLDAAADLQGDTETHPGLDVGAMAKFGTARFGVMVRNARRPTFGSGEQEFTLDRHVRAGIAFSSPAGLATLAADVDVTAVTNAMGEERRFSAGFEAWGRSKRIGLRGGVSADTIGEALPAASGGLSVAVRSGTFLDVAATTGADVARRGWGFALRVTF